MPYSPWWLQFLYPSLIWKKAGSKEKSVYLTFDDGPTPEITEAVLAQLANYRAKATFFLIGKNAEAFPQLVASIQKGGHAIGNHTQNHFNGWQHSTSAYIENIRKAERFTSDHLFRPPYGRITRSQIKALKKLGYQIVMWEVLSGDFSTAFSAEKCTEHVLRHTKNGSILVFHDSVKAWPRLESCLPHVLAALSKQGYRFDTLN